MIRIGHCMGRGSVEEGIQEQAANPDADGAIGHIEGWPVISLPEKIQEIDHLPQPQAINAIAYRPPHNQADTPQRQETLPGRVFKIQHQYDYSQHGHGREKQPQEGGLLTRPEAKRRTRVAHIRQVKEIRDHEPRLVQHKGVMDVEFAPDRGAHQAD
jgi:hypothetical protein